jgi:hypothetical protein
MPPSRSPRCRRPRRAKRRSRGHVAGIRSTGPSSSNTVFVAGRRLPEADQVAEGIEYLAESFAGEHRLGSPMCDASTDDATTDHRVHLVCIPVGHRAGCSGLSVVGVGRVDGQASSGDVEGCESRMLIDGIGSQQRPVLLDGCREIVGEVEDVSHPKDRGHNRPFLLVRNGTAMGLNSTVGAGLPAMHRRTGTPTTHCETLRSWSSSRNAFLFLLSSSTNMDMRYTEKGVC